MQAALACYRPANAPYERVPGTGSRAPAFTRQERESWVSDSAETVPAPADWALLIEAISQRQDRAAFAQLFGHFAPRVKTFMRRSGASDAAADELAQETLLAVWRKASQFDPATAGASAWIFTIARNLRIDALRRERRGGIGDSDAVDLEFVLDESPSPDVLLASAQVESRVKGALAALSDEQMRVVQLSFFQEKAHAEIAQMLSIPLGTVKSRLRLAMTKLRALLEDLS
jgi:RNA polymerase sigma-70 factor (ECF subfamily)